MKVDVSPVVGSAIVDVIFENERILVILEDGRTLAAPLTWAGPRVAAMSASERSKWVHTADRRGVNWPSAGQVSEEGTINVWSLEQDALFEAALAELKDAGWNAGRLDSRARALVALWRLIADGYNGGLLQFLGNWGIAEVNVALEALIEVKAINTFGTVSEFWRLVGPIAESDEVTTMDDLYAGIPDELSGRIDELDKQFWDAVEELIQLVPLFYGPAKSAWIDKAEA